MVQTHNAWQIYRNELIKLGNGIPLWEPAPLHNYEQVTIGDVGYVREGAFHLLFSAAKPLGDRVPGEDVPTDFVPLDPGPIEFKQPRAPGPLYAGKIKQEGANFGASADISSKTGANICFQTSSERGAILLTKDKTYRGYTARPGNLQRYMRRHYKSWLAFANEHGHMVELEDITLVTAHEMTNDFAMAAFSSNSNQISLKFEAGFPATASASASVWGAWATTTSVHYNCGPQRCKPPSSISGGSEEVPQDESCLGYNQCVFVTGMRMRRRAKMFPKVIKAAAGPHDLGPGRRFDEAGLSVLSEDSDDSDYEVMDIPESSSSFIDPMDSVFRYLFENSDADVAIVHDPDVMKITGTSSLEDMDLLVSRLTPNMIEMGADGVAFMRCQDTSTNSIEIPERIAVNPSHHVRNNLKALGAESDEDSLISTRVSPPHHSKQIEMVEGAGFRNNEIVDAMQQQTNLSICTQTSPYPDTQTSPHKGTQMSLETSIDESQIDPLLSQEWYPAFSGRASLCKQEPDLPSLDMCFLGSFGSSYHSDPILRMLYSHHTYTPVRPRDDSWVSHVLRFVAPPEMLDPQTHTPIRTQHDSWDSNFSRLDPQPRRLDPYAYAATTPQHRSWASNVIGFDTLPQMLDPHTYTSRRHRHRREDTHTLLPINTKSIIDEHIDVYHEKRGQRYRCLFPGCNNPPFHSESVAISHVSLVDLQGKQFTCSCGKKFSNMIDAKRHVHHLEKRFKCNVCSKFFLRKGYQMKHEALCFSANS